MFEVYRSTLAQAVDLCLTRVFGKSTWLTGKIQECATGPEGQKLLAINGKETSLLQRELSSVTTVRVSGTNWNGTNYQYPTTNFTEAFCKNSPKLCPRGPR